MISALAEMVKTLADRGCDVEVMVITALQRSEQPGQRPAQDPKPPAGTADAESQTQFGVLDPRAAAQQAPAAPTQSQASAARAYALLAATTGTKVDVTAGEHKHSEGFNCALCQRDQRLMEAMLATDERLRHELGLSARRPLAPDPCEPR